MSSLRIRMMSVAAVVLSGAIHAGSPVALAQAAPQPQTPPATQPAQPPAPPAQPTPPTEGQPAQPVFRTDVELVAIDVSVVDKMGNPVRGLGPDDFVVKVDGERRKLVQAEFVRQDSKTGVAPGERYSSNEGAYGGRLIMLVVDIGNIRHGRGAMFIRSANRLLDDLGPGDRVGLAVIPGGEVIDFTAHLALIRQKLSLLSGSATALDRPQRISLSESIDYVERNDRRTMDEAVQRECQLIRTAEELEYCRRSLVEEAEQRVHQAQINTQTSMTALRALFRQLQRIPGTKTLIMLSEGLVLTRSIEDLGWVPGESAEAKASMYALRLDETFIDATVQRPSARETDDRRLLSEGLNLLVGMARGASFDVVANGEGTFQRLSRELTGYYLLAFEADPSERDGKPHRFSVEVKRPGIEVRSRREFTARASTAPKTEEEILADTLRDPLLATELRMRVSTYNFPDPASKNVRVLVAADLGRPSDELGAKALGFKVTDDGANLVASRLEEVSVRTSGARLHYTTVVVPPGSYTIKLACVDPEGRRGSVEHRFTAALTSNGALQTGDLMLSDPSITSDAGLAPVIEPSIRGGAVTGYVELLSAEAERLADSTVVLEVAKDAQAAPLASQPMTVSATKSPERRIAEGDVVLAALPPGNYVARAIISIADKPVARLLQPFAYDPSSEALARSGSKLAGRGTAVQAFERTAVLQPVVAEYFLRQVETQFQDSATPQYESAMQLARAGRFTELPDAIQSTADQSAPALAFLRGLGLYARGDLEPAAVEFRRALRASSDFVPATFYLGACYAAGGRDKEAVGAWQTTLASDEGPGSPGVYQAAVDAYLRLGNTEGAVEVAKEGAAAFPDDDQLRLRFVRAHAAAGKPVEALQALEPYLERHAQDQESLFLAMRLIYEASRASETTARDAAAPLRARFEQYLRAYTAAGGPNVAIAQEWLRALEAPSSPGA